MALAHKRSVTRAYEADGIEVFFDVIEPPRPLIIFGAEADAQPLVELAKNIGWRVTIVDVKARAATKVRFNRADEITLCRPEDVMRHVFFGKEAALVVMTHNYLADLQLLKTLLPLPISYLGILGPKRRTAHLLSQLQETGIEFSDLQLNRLYAPAGIDIGGETPEEVALCIIAEIKAVDTARAAGFLRDSGAPIHDDPFVIAASISETDSYSITTEAANALISIGWQVGTGPYSINL